MKITKIFTFDSAHRLPWHKGKCFTLHGHTYKLEVTVEGPLNKDGIVVDFGDLKKVVKKEILDKYDHKYLNKFFDNPTAELVVKEFHKILRKDFNIVRLRLWETPTSYAEI
tara:strand:- start:902 stop:1234 length:333 start_codon:yes stop_codon:yes gene_type:complete